MRFKAKTIHFWNPEKKAKAMKLMEYITQAVKIPVEPELGSVAGPVIQANRRLTFEDDLRSGGLL